MLCRTKRLHQPKEVIMTRITIALIRFGSAKALTQAQIPAGRQESKTPLDGYGV